MPHAALSAAIARTRTAVAPPAETDGELLGRYVRSRDEAAFAGLVRTLGPMVLGVCRRVAGDPHLADDAFQAAFLVLARRAADVRPGEGVRGWLYGVAVRTAREARTVSARRQSRECPVPSLPDRAADVPEPPDADALRILDEEVAALPDHLRTAVVLCELDGLPRRVAAERLGVAEGTLSSRLAKARKVLADRVRRRGVAVPAAGLGMLLAASPVSARLAAKTFGVLTADPVPAAVVLLTKGVFRTMYLQKLTAPVLAALALAACLLAPADSPRAAAGPAPAPRLVPKQPAKKPAGPGTIVVGRTGATWVLAPDGKKLGELAAPDKTVSVAAPALSPDGKRVAFVVNEELPPMVQREDPWPLKVVVRSLAKPGDEKVWDLPAAGLSLCWTADGKRIVASKQLAHDVLTTRLESVLLDPDTGKTEALCDHRVLDCGKDGKTYLVESHDPEKKVKSLGLYSTDDKQVRPLTTLGGHASTFEGRLSPDGTAVLFTDGDRERKDAWKWGVSHRPYLLDVKTKERKPLADFPENGQAVGVAWSPDGTKIAYAWRHLHAERLKKDTIDAADTVGECEAFVIVADRDGKNAKTIATEKSDNTFNTIFRTLDWR